MKTSLVRAKKYSFVYKNTYPMYLRELSLLFISWQQEQSEILIMESIQFANQIVANLELQLSKEILETIQSDQHLK